MKTIEQEWTAFAAMVLPKTASETKRVEMKRAFYGGAWAMWCGIQEIGEPLEAELRELSRRLMAEYAEKN